VLLAALAFTAEPLLWRQPGEERLHTAEEIEALVAKLEAEAS